MGNRKRKKKKNSTINQKVRYHSNSELDMALNAIAHVRTGGAVNVRGLGFQLFYSCYRLLTELSKKTSGAAIRLEGVEDIDVIHVDDTEFVQLKSSVNKIDASTFWDMKVLQNFLPVYRANPDTSLRLVYNFGIAKGNLSQLSVGNKSGLGISYWLQKFKNSGLAITEKEFEGFISRIVFEKVDVVATKKACIDALTTQFQLNAGTQAQYLKALFYHAFQWAENRETVELEQLQSVIQLVTDSFSKSPTNPAISNNWISEVSFQPLDSAADSTYFEGKAARPGHIAQNLPVPRKDWERKIQETVTEFSVTVIKSSSGQGKSTLAWRCAQSLKSKGYCVYELQHCYDWTNVAAIVDFIKTRLSIGQVPIIVVDGLHSNNSDWKRLAEQVANMPVKLIVTTREEDWYRFGLDTSKVSLQIIDIQLSMNEARGVFNQLKKKGKLHNPTLSWQPAWERIKDRGLLIEYIYLLTRGQLIEERINEQVKQLNAERDGAAKLEILRLVALADVLNISLESQALTKYVKDSVGFVGDRGEVYKQLEHEYYIRLDRSLVEGLHAVRSKHLVHALHQTIQFEESLIALFEIIEEKFVHDYFSSISGYVESIQKQAFFDQLAKQVSSRPYSVMVHAIDGLMRGETTIYWQRNRKIFDEVAEAGAIDFFIMETLPYTKLGLFDSFKETLGGEGSNFDLFAQKHAQLSVFDPSNSDLLVFVTCLGKHLSAKASHPDSFSGIGFLAQWFQQLDVSFPIALQFSQEELLTILHDEAVDDVAALFSYLAICVPETHAAFIEKSKQEILSTLKRATQSVTIEECGKDVHIEYLLSDDADKANDFSVERIETVHSLLPNYERYCTQAIILPFPNEEMYEVVLQNSTKHMPKENVGDNFIVHINQMWYKSILKKYAASSAYEWQEKYIHLRKEALDFAKKCIRNFEARLEGNDSKISSSSKPLIEQTNRTLVAFRHFLKYPDYSDKVTDDEPFKKEQGLIRDWYSSMNNFCNQFVGIINPKSDNDRNLALRSLQTALSHLQGMQRGYDVIVSEHSYFKTEQLITSETVWYERLLKTIECYASLIESSARAVALAKPFVESWWNRTRNLEISQVIEIIKEYESDTDYTFVLPRKIIQEGTLSKVVIGVEGMDLEILQDGQELLYFLADLVDLTITGIDSFIFVNLLDNKAVNAFCVPRYFFERLEKVVADETAEFEDSEFGNPYPLNVDEALIESLEGVEVKQVPQSDDNFSFGDVMFGLWKLCEHRKRLDNSKTIESDWLEEVESTYAKEIKANWTKAKAGLESKELERCQSLIDKVITSHYMATNEEVLELLAYRLGQINKTILNH